MVYEKSGLLEAAAIGQQWALGSLEAFISPDVPGSRK